MKLGRIPSITPERVAEILSLLRVGNTDEVSANASGINKATFYNWMKRARIAQARMDAGEEIDKGEQVYLDFFDSVKRAKAEAIASAVTHVRRAMSKNWIAAMTFLERRDPENWGRRDRMDIRATGTFGVVRINKEDEALVKANLKLFFPALGKEIAEDE